MRKLFIVTGAIAFLGIQNLTIASEKPNISLKEYQEIIQLLKQKVQVNKELLQQEEKVYNSITGSRTTAKLKQNNEDLFLSQPNFIYDKSKHDDIIRKGSLTAENIQKEEGIDRFTGWQHARTSVSDRIQYVTAIDKAVSLEAFSATENRFQKIAEILITNNKMDDLKSIAEMHAHIKIMLAMIQNEATKLQMVAYSREAEQALIKQQERALYSYVFKQKHKKMPQIRINSSTLGSS